ncbi:uncharacterized protein LOC143766171 isoform X2 [Ranitomeya variabilis]|uniref:uncharacterized protein LOC143766171 isoform X2 n=1 Tax=Ranitomeya variabilis TaxID=490064 RepID=UPI004056740F
MWCAALQVEDYTLVKKTSSERCQDPVSEGWERNLSPITGPPPHPLIHDDINDQKILELTYKIIELLTGEVPVRCLDVTVYLSMEEWEYLEGHKDLYKDVMMEVPQPLTSPDDCIRRLTRNPIFSDFKATDRGSMQDTNEEDVTIPDIPSAFLNEDISSDTFKHVIPSNSSQTVKQSKSPRIGNDHQRAHIGQKPCSFLDCEKSYSIKSVVVQLESSQTGEKTISESECEKFCSSKPSLVKHQRIHGGLKPFLCSDCGKCYNHKSQLLRHQKSHTEEKPFSCLQCSKGFNQKSDLVRHQRIHTGEKPYSCLECGNSFNQKSDLARHERSHTGEKPFSCSECGKYFSCKSTLVTHHRNHTGEKPFLCSECGKCFTEKLRLVRHQRIHTKEKPF